MEKGMGEGWGGRGRGGRREGKGEKGKGWRREEGKVTEGMGGTGQGMRWDAEGREREWRKGMEMEERCYSIPKLQFLALATVDTS